MEGMPSGDHKMEGMEMGGTEEHAMQMGSLPMPRMLAIIIATFACLLAAGGITSALFAAITFR
jgi:hypothetical protein